jgi:enoyl-CoA hydratase/carnithine racemase
MTLETERDGPVLVVTINRPSARNAVDLRTATLLASTFAAFDADDAASVAVLTGAGGTSCAGALACWCDLRSWRRAPCSAGSAVVSACPSSTAGPCGCPG